MQRVNQVHDKSYYGEYMSPVFKHQAYNITETAIIQSEYKRNDFYELNFKVPWSESDKYDLTIIDLTNSGFPYMRHENL